MTANGNIQQCRRTPTLTFPCDACRIRPGHIDDIGRRLCDDPGCCVDDKPCPVLEAPCPWPWDCDHCQIKET